MDWKKATLFLLFVIAGHRALWSEHDSYQMWIALESAFIAYFAGWFFLKQRKVLRAAIAAAGTVALCQLSVIVKRAFLETGFKRALAENPFGYIVADIAYGFRHIFLTVAKALGAVSDFVVYDSYSGIEQMNYRFFTAFVMIVIMLWCIAREKGPVPAGGK